MRSWLPQRKREQERAEEGVLRKGMPGSAGQAAVNSVCAGRVLEKCEKPSDTGHPHANLSHSVRHVSRITYTVPVSPIPLGRTTGTIILQFLVRVLFWGGMSSLSVVYVNLPQLEFRKASAQVPVPKRLSIILALFYSWRISFLLGCPR